MNWHGIMAGRLERGAGEVEYCGPCNRTPWQYREIVERGLLTGHEICVMCRPEGLPLGGTRGPTAQQAYLP
jgi:hypothetical protein